MSHKGFSLIGLSTLDLNETRAFYEDVLGFKAVCADILRVREGGRLRHIFFDVGRSQLIAFLEAEGVAGIPKAYDTGITRGLGVPAAFYHFAFEAGTVAALAAKRDELHAKGVEVSDIVDHGWARSIYFRDPNGLSLEYCCVMRDFNQDDATIQARHTIDRAALDLGKGVSAELSVAQPVRA